MSVVAPLVALAVMVAIAALALLVAPEGRPGIDSAPEGWIAPRG